MHDAKENREKKMAAWNPGSSFRVLLAPMISRDHFFLAVFVRVTHDGLSERGTTRSLECKWQFSFLFTHLSHMVSDTPQQSALRIQESAQACLHGVNRLATKGEKYHSTADKTRKKNYRLATKILISRVTDNQRPTHVDPRPFPHDRQWQLRKK